MEKQTTDVYLRFGIRESQEETGAEQEEILAKTLFKLLIHWQPSPTGLFPAPLLQ